LARQTNKGKIYARARLASIEEEQGFLLRKDPQSGETVGVTILDYEEHFRQLPNLSWLSTKPLPKD
jgi:hypothetical protein